VIFVAGVLETQALKQGDDVAPLRAGGFTGSGDGDGLDADELGLQRRRPWWNSDSAW
jgi:hypothetical protein